MAFPILVPTPSILLPPSEALLETFAPLSPIFEAPEILIHQAPDVFALWQAWEVESGSLQNVPYWVNVWPASRLMIQFLQHHPNLFMGKTIVDIGSGCGATSIAALKFGAAQCLVNDIDPIAIWVAKKNYLANFLSPKNNIQFSTSNLLCKSPSKNMEVILVADLFYDKTSSEALLKWLTVAQKLGSRVFIADAGRPFAPTKNVKILSEGKFTTQSDLEGREERMVRILELCE